MRCLTKLAQETAHRWSLGRRGAWLWGVVAVGLLALAVGCATAPRYRFVPQKTTLAADRVELPTSEMAGLLLAEVRLNGAGPFRLMVDTGATGLCIPEALARQLGLPEVPRSETTGEGHGVTVKVRTVRVARLECGGLTLEKIEALQMRDADMANLRQAMPEADGVLDLPRSAMSNSNSISRVSRSRSVGQVPDNFPRNEGWNIPACFRT